MLESIKATASRLRQYAILVYFCARDPRTPVYVRLLALCIAAYAFSPIDLIPDFIPVIGLLDDLLLIPLGVALVMRIIPPEVLESARFQAQQVTASPVSYPAAILIVAIWVLLISVFIYWVVGAAGK